MPNNISIPGAVAIAILVVLVLIVIVRNKKIPVLRHRNFFSNRKLPPPAAEGVFCVFVRRERKSHKEWFLCTGKRIPCKHGEIMKST